MSFKNLRVAVLLLVLLVVIGNSYRDKHQNWDRAVYIGLYPINADGSPKVQAYIEQLTPQDFRVIDTYMSDQSKKFGRPVKMYYRLGETVANKPPAVPRNGTMTDAIIWSLKFRYYAYKNRPNTSFKPNLTLFLQYYDPDTPILTHTSTALQNGRIGVVNLFASAKKADTNNVVIAHESLHGFGAIDHYDLRNGQPLYPIGYANPDQTPLYPQKKAALMAVHRPLAPDKFIMAKSLDETVINDFTAKEVGWVDD